MNLKGQTESLHVNRYQRQQAATLLRDQILSFRTTQLLAVAAKLNIAEHLNGSARTAESLSSLVDANADALYRLMRALASMGVFQEHADRTFSNNQTSDLLLDSTPGSLRSIAILYGEPWLWSAYGRLMYSVQTGQPAFDHVHGKPMYEFFQADLGASEAFNSAMSAFSDIEAEAIIKAYNFSLKNAVVDVGGGEGALVKAIVNAYPNVKGIVFDMLPVDNVRSHSCETRMTYVQGDFFAEVPTGGDVYLLKSVLHNWDDDSCIKVLKNCRNNMKSTSSLLVIERVVPGPRTKSDAKIFDINMLVMVGGKERTEDEYRKIFREAGFTLKRVIHTQSSLSIVEAIPGL